MSTQMIVCIVIFVTTLVSYVLNKIPTWLTALLSLGIPVTACRILGAVHGFTVNRTPGWEKALELHHKFFQAYL